MRINTVLAAIILWTLGVSASQAYAGCWWERRGTFGGAWKCDSAGIVPTFDNVMKTIGEFQGLSSECKNSTKQAASKWLDCGGSIAGALKSGDATVFVGPDDACSQWSQEVDNAQDACHQKINFRSRNFGAKLCNQYTETVWFAVGYSQGGQWVADGWYDIPPGECKSVMKGKLQDNAYAYASTNPFGTGAVEWAGNVDFCVSRDRFAALNRTQPCQEKKMFQEITTKSGSEFVFGVKGASNAGAATGSGGQQAVELCNRSTKQADFSVAFVNGGAWTSVGWWGLAPSKCVNVLGGRLQGGRVFAYAKSGAVEWSGTQGYFCVDQQNAFELQSTAACQGGSLKQVGFREVVEKQGNLYRYFITD